jgi:hypothetical protein
VDLHKRLIHGLRAETQLECPIPGIALAGVLASDHLRATLDDGSAALSLARPVPREAFAVARLMGVTAVAGAVVLGIAGFLLATRSALPLTPALCAAGACALGALTVGALAMAASLVLPRAVTVLLVLGSVALVFAFRRVELGH